ncbi:MAG: ion transporter [Chromatiales bacterium]|nr:ion transporter [Chromatiales bacterium]
MIVLNAAILAIDALPESRLLHRDLLGQLDEVILWVFVAELLLRVVAHGRRFFVDPWSIFDTLVVGVSLLPATGGLIALRAFRVLRVLRFISMFPRLRSVVAGLLSSIPGIASVATMMVLILFVSAIVAADLFGERAPEQFGDLWVSMFTLFKVMTLEGWPDLADAVMEQYPYAWLFFLVYILVATLTLMNFFVAVIVNAMEAEALDQKATVDMQEQLMTEVSALRAEMAAFRIDNKRELDEIEDLLERERGRAPPNN